MKKLLGSTTFLVIFLLSMPFWLITCSKVEQGYRGAKIDLYSGDKGEITEYGSGVHWYNPIGVDWVNLPIFTQRYAYVRNPKEESVKDQSFDAVSSDNLTFGVGVAIHYSVNPIDGCAAAVYRKYKTGDFRELALGPVRDVVRGTVKNTFSQYEAEAIYGSERPEVMEEIYKKVKTRLGDRVNVTRQDSTVGCFDVDQLNLAELRAPDKLKKAVQEKMKAQQKAQSARAKLQEQRILSRRDSVRAAQEAKNNRMLAQSLSEEVIKYQRLQLLKKKWNGQLPRVMSGSGGMGLMLDERN